MPDAQTQVEYALVADVVREELERTGFIANSCILAARMTGIVLRELGIAGVEAMAAELDAFSPAYVAMRKLAFELGRDLTQSEADKFAADGAWRVQLRFGPAPAGVEDRRARGYNGHVVTLVERKWMIDPTLPQANRPEKRLLVEPPFAWEIDYEEARTKGHVTQCANGTIAVHRLLPGRKDFTRAPDWRLVPPDDETVARILNRLTGK